mmetsp:Transcript_42794/g.48626  ORF Transcript_42794/g.48626 Transcript_42794/m.48626 type:complete len:209 (-) Transcript_42794:70-696(-)|eukprot:CAMPEP_0194135788 /NCGR_PEP_ID=MMETSP0152-20130528/5866_1 /TAXON_ID=1049557 /ORGANISM="Thalassiothrix antarctica, Strain L6-D1" /LENGTH=208 /DNA_ID=CAMNT_0038832183 /DNA_START=43 /DNA_END=669 /DNA_ORIENTATION=-
MAPNNKQLNLILQDFSPVDLLVSKSSYPPLTQNEQKNTEPLTPAGVDNYWSWTSAEDQRKEQEDSYWDWSESPSTTVLSSKSIVENLIQTSAVGDDLVRSAADSHDSWNVTSSKDRETHTTIDQHESEVPRNNTYWHWTSSNEEKRVLQSDTIIKNILEDERLRQALSKNLILNSSVQEDYDAYWGENDETITSMSSENYWNTSVATR